MHGGEAPTDDPGDVGDERSLGDSGGNVLQRDGHQQARHPFVGAKQSRQCVEAQQVRDRVDVRTALGQIGVNEIAEHRQNRADQDGLQPAEPQEQITANRDTDHRHDDAENLRGEGDLVFRIVQEI